MIGSKGDLKQGMLGALTAGFMHPMKAGIAHGVTGGVRSRLSGGSFKSGFLGSAVSYGASWSGAYEAAGVSSQANTWAQRAQNVIASYVFGGVAAELGGGKFANGGMSAAFSRMFNDTLTLGISFKAPVWIQKVLGLDVSVQGFGAGFALSYPGFSGGKLDFGMYGKTALGGEGIGFGKVSGDFSWQTGSVSDIKGTGGEMNIHSGVHGVSMTTGNNGNVDGFGYSRGFGYNASSAGTMNGNCSIRSWSCGN